LSQADAWRPPAALQNATTASIIPLAVLPFAALGDSGSTTQLIADMMTDDLINVLSRVPVFRVISRQTTNRYKDQPADLATIGADLQVRYVLEGSVRTQDSILRVNVQLLNAATRLPVWSDRVEREQGERHAVRDEIVARIARELQIDILPIEGERRSADQSADASACSLSAPILNSITSPISTSAEHRVSTDKSVMRSPPSQPEFERKIQRWPTRELIIGYFFLFLVYVVSLLPLRRA